MDPTSQWHKSAFLSTAMETVTLQTRMKDNAFGPKLADLSATLNPSGSRNISLISMTLPTDPNLAGGHDSRHGSMTIIDSAPEPHVADLSWTGNSPEKHLFSCVKVSRGIPVTEVDSTPSKPDASMLQVIPQRLVLSCSGYSLATYRLFSLPLLEVPELSLPTFCSLIFPKSPLSSESKGSTNTCSLAGNFTLSWPILFWIASLMSLPDAKIPCRWYPRCGRRPLLRRRFGGYEIQFFVMHRWMIGRISTMS